MRSPVRKLMGVAVIGLLGALFAAPMVGAGAQEFIPGEGAPPVPGDCVILSVTPNPVTAFPATVTMTGTAPNDVHMVLYVDGVPTSEQDVTDGTFSLSANLTQAADLSANYTYGNENAYTAGCATPGGEVVVRVDVKGAQAAQANALAFTGSSNTPSYVLIGIAALVFGAVLVVAARRRSQVS